MASSTQATSRRRFQPSLISTVKDSFRLPQKQQQPQPGPAPELTPEPSPIEDTPPPHDRFPSPQEEKQQRRFAPQLIETSRRCRRTGDTSPATKPTDKTDITPWANHIYAPKSRRKPEEDVEEGEDEDEAGAADESSVASSVASSGSFWVIEAEEEKRRQRLISRRESCTADGLFNEFEFVRKAYAKAQSTRTEEAILSAFPNYNPARYEGVEHFNHGRESSEDEQDHKKKSEAQPKVRRRRDSEVNWFAKEHQQYAEELQKARGEFEDKAYLSPTAYRSPTEELDLELGDSPPAAPIWIGRAAEKAPARSPSSFARGPIGETYMPLIPETHITPFIPSKPITIRAPERKRSSSGIRPIGETFMPYIPSAPPGKAADTPFTASPARQNIGFRNAGAAFNKVRVITPPMAGQDLKFRRCESPQMTKMEPDYPFFPEHETNRDCTGQKGLWNGYCLAKHSEEIMVPAELHGPHMLSTPSRRSPELSPTLNNGLCEEPPSISLHPFSTPEHRMKSGEPKGLHMLTGLSERLKTEKERSEREDLITAEFGDDFVTQVYNYLSLGYPAMARDYDYELAKISGIPVWELRQGDDALLAKGHITMEMGDKTTKCPRWRALKTYIFEWARQHPNLSFDGPDPLHWGMRERRGSWAI